MLFASDEASALAGFSTSQGDHDADVVILAAGLNTSKLAKKLGGDIRLADKPGTLTILTQPMPKFLNHIIVTGKSNTRQLLMMIRISKGMYLICLKIVLCSQVRLSLSHVLSPSYGKRGMKSVAYIQIDEGKTGKMSSTHCLCLPAEDAFIMQRRDGEVMISFFKAAVNHSPKERQDRPAESPDNGIAGRVVHSAEESQAGHEEEACELLNESDEIAEQVSKYGFISVGGFCLVFPWQDFWLLTCAMHTL